MRSYNERLILQLIRQRGNLTKAEATRATGLSANAVSMIFRALEGEDMNLILREEPLRGRVGQPSTPMRLNPEAHTFLGLKIGRRSMDLVVVDFTGGVLAQQTARHDYPTPDASVAYLRRAVPKILRSAGVAHDKVSGFGIAMPSEIWHWRDETGAPEAAMAIWRDFDLVDAVAQATGWQVQVFNDGTAACGAELVFTHKETAQDFIYLFVGTMIGGGVVLNGSVFFGRTGNAGGFGPFRVPGGTPGGDRLIDHASLYVLYQMLSQSGVSGPYGPEIWQRHAQIVDSWLDLAARGIAHTIASSLSIIDFEAVILDGGFPQDIRTRLTDRVRRKFLAMDLQGIAVPTISEGSWGPLARAVGAAALIIDARYSIDQNMLLRG